MGIDQKTHFRARPTYYWNQQKSAESDECNARKSPTVFFHAIPFVTWRGKRFISQDKIFVLLCANTYGRQNLKRGHNLKPAFFRSNFDKYYIHSQLSIDYTFTIIYCYCLTVFYFIYLLAIEIYIIFNPEFTIIKKSCFFLISKRILPNSTLHIRTPFHYKKFNHDRY